MKQLRITILLTVLMSMFGANAFAHDIEVANKDGVIIFYKWINDNTELAVSYKGSYAIDYSNEYSGVVVIPESVEYEGKTYSVTSIGSDAFYGCSGLTSVTIPNSVTSIDFSAFEDCSSLTSLTIPNSVNSIGSNAFKNTVWYNNQPDGLIYAGKVAYKYKGEMSANTVITLEDGTLGITSYAFSGCSGLTSVTIPNSMTSIGECAFANCSGLTSVTIPNSVTSIGPRAFEGCSSLISVIIPNSVTSIGYSAFSGCSGLTSLTIPNSVNSIGSNAFENTAWYNNQPDGLVYAGKVAYSYKGEMPANTAITLEDGTLGITSYAFSGCSGLTSVTIPNSVISIGNDAFWNCYGLTSVTIPINVTSIGEGVFGRCFGLTSITVEDGNTVYDSRNNCNAIIEKTSNALIAGCNNTTIPDGVTSIGRNVFSGCNGLVSIDIPNSVSSIGYSAFSGCSGLISLTIPNSVTSIGTNAFGGCDGLASVTIGNGVTSIGDLAFVDCRSLTSLTIPDNVTTIGKCVFEDSCLRSVIIGKGLTSMDNSAFSNCYYLHKVEFHCKEIPYWFYESHNLREVIIGNEVTSISERAFENCENLSFVVIGSGLTTIGKGVFNNCQNLYSVVIGSGVKTIEYDAFSNTNIKKAIWLTNTPPSGSSYAAGAINYVANNQFVFSTKKEVYVYPLLSSYFDVDGIRYVPVSLSDKTCDAIDCVRYENDNTNINIASTVSYKGISMTVNNIMPYFGYANWFIENLTIDNDGQIGNYSFYGCSRLKSVKLGSNVSSIGDYAFRGCSYLESVTIPNLVESINLYAFSYCSRLKEVKIGSKVKAIQQYAFCYCKSLPTIKIPQSVTSIMNGAFYECSSLKEVIIDDSETELNLGSNYSGSSNATNKFKDPLFSSCPLDTVYIGRNIIYGTDKNSGYSPFYNNTTLRAVRIADKETEISENEFYGCTNLQRVIIGDGVTTIGNWAFSGCSSLKFFTFGSKVKTIGQEAFSDCTAVTEITSRAVTPPTCGTQALDDINKWECKLYVPKGHLAEYQVADQWKEFLFVEEGDIVITPTKETITISSALQVTYMSDKNLDFTSKPELKAYVATGYDKFTGTIWLTRVKYVPANTGFLVMGEAGSYDIPVVPGGPTSYYVNLFKGTLDGTTIYTTEGNFTNYYLSNGEFGVSFYKVTKEEGVTIGANRAYLQIPTEIPTVGVAGNTETINVTAAGQVPYYNSQSLDFSSLDAQGVKAYTATGYDYSTGTIWLTRVKQVPAETGILIMAPQGEYPVPTASVATVYANMFKGTLTGTTIQTHETIAGEDYINYYLSSGKSGVGFYKVTKEGGVAIGANRCYLPIKNKEAAGTRSAGSGQNQIAFEEADEVIGIQLMRGIGGDEDGTTNLTPALSKGEGAWYTLQGQRVDKPGKGLYIHNGKKVVIK
ncbi:MAG: leucine-rich repeat domain-containing protein [Prevotella sp.]|nr:leucine-rich repeat domain-containing protein [Prevotella sp.]